MVNSETDNHLDDVILEVFELADSQAPGSSRQFFFPVTTQKEARAFVRELNVRGVDYASICAAVNEFEHNFSAWRTGIGRPGIGNRVIERINRPIQQLLITDADLDDASDLSVQLSDLDDDDDEQILAELSSSLPPSPARPIARRTSDKNDVKTSLQQTSNERDETDRQMDRQTDNHCHQTDKSGTAQEICNGDDFEVHTSAKSLNIQPPCDGQHLDADLLHNAADVEHNNNCNIVNKSLSSTDDSRVPADGVENHLDEVESHIRRDQIQLDQTITPEHQPMSTIGNDKVGTVKAEMTSSNENDGVMSSSQSHMEQIKTQPDLESTTAEQHTASTTGRDEVGSVLPEVTSSSETDADNRRSSSAGRQDSWMTELSINLSTDQHHPPPAASAEHRHIAVRPVSTLTSSHNALPQPTTSGHVESAPETHASVTVLSQQLASDDTADKPETTSETTSTAELQEPSDDVIVGKPEAVVSTAVLYQSEVTSLVEAQKPDDDVTADSKKPEAVAIAAVSDQSDVTVDETITGNTTTTTRTTAEVATKSAVEPEMTSQGKTTSSVRRRRGGEVDEAAGDDIDESYDSSDADDDDDGVLARPSSAVRRRRKRWGRRYDDDGPGFLYAFTDSPATDDRRPLDPSPPAVPSRVKVSASRQPHSRLRQARLFNVDVRLVTAVRVTRRLTAACRVRERLSSDAIAGTLDWFQTPLDTLLNTIMDVASSYSPDL